MRVILTISLLFTLLFSQVRVGEMQSITSSLDVQTLIGSGDDIILATRTLEKSSVNNSDVEKITRIKY